MSSTGFFDLPTELHEEILSYLPFDDPPTLQGLQLGLTCKALYEILESAIVKIQVGRLLEATETYSLQLCRLEPSPNMSTFQAAPLEFRSNDYDSNWRTIHSASTQRDTINHAFYPSRNPHLEDFGITYAVMIRRGPSAVEEIWCLHSLISRSQHLRRISLRIYCPGEEENIGRKWTRAFLKLLEVCAEQPGIEITVTDPGSVYDSMSFKPLTRLFVREETVHQPSTVLSSISSSLQRFGWKSSSADVNTTQPALLHPTDFVFSPEDFVTSRLSLLSLSGGGVFDHLHYPFLHHLALQSSSTLTRLHLNQGSHHSDDWRAMLSWWRFPRLSHFSVRESMVPLDVLLSFLQCHPTLTNVSLWVHYYIHDGSTVPLLQEIKEDFLPNIRQMVASPSLLIHILSSSALSSSKFTFKKTAELLSSVERLTISQEHDCLRGSNTALKFKDISRVLSLVAARRYNTNLMPRLHTLSIRTMYQAQQAFQEWLRGVIGQGATPADSRSPSSRSSSSPSSSTAAAAKNESYPVSNLPLRGIQEFYISAYSYPYYNQVWMVPTMNVDPNLVVDFIAHLFRGHNDGGSAGGLKRVVLSNIFTSSTVASMNPPPWREVDTVPLAIGRIWERCADLEEVRYLRFGRDDPTVEKVWKRPTELP